MIINRVIHNDKINCCVLCFYLVALYQLPYILVITRNDDYTYYNNIYMYIKLYYVTGNSDCLHTIPPLPSQYSNKHNNTCHNNYTVESPNKGHFGSGASVLYSEIVLWWKVQLHLLILATSSTQIPYQTCIYKYQPGIQISTLGSMQFVRCPESRSVCS